MRRLFEKTPVIDLAVDIELHGISIGDDLTFAAVGSEPCVLYFSPKRRFLARLLPNRSPKRLGCLDHVIADELLNQLSSTDRVRIRVVDAIPAHLSSDGTQSLFVSIWVS